MEKKKRNIIICVSWPYANSNLHLGHIASSLSGDILARYHRMAGDDVFMVSGADCHGTKIELLSKKWGITPKEVSDKFYNNFVKTFNAYSFSFDKFAVTYGDFHKETCKKLFLKMYENGYIYEKTLNRPFCPKCNKFVADTEIEITCPLCAKRTKADNCDCGHVPCEADLEGATCLICGGETQLRRNDVLMFKLTAFKDFLQNNLDRNKYIWRANSINETTKYLDSLCDRVFSRELEWGVDIPIKGFEQKKVWVWYEALLGYITDTMILGEEKGFDWRKFWKTDHEPETEKIIYMSHAKDNIVFHSLFFPAMLSALNDKWVTPNIMVSSEYLLFNDEKISKSSATTGLTFEAGGWAEKYDTDSIRMHFILNGPEKRDSNFSEDLLINTHNTEVVNKFGNLVNRTLKYKELTEIPDGKLNDKIEEMVKDAYKTVAESIESLEFKKAGGLIINLISSANKFFDDEKPWIQSKENTEAFNNTIFSCAYVIANLGILLDPFMPKAARKIREFLGLPADKNKWQPVTVKKHTSLSKVQPLFSRI